MIVISSFSTKTNSLYAKQTFFKFFHTSSFTFFHSFIHFKLPWITSLSNLSNCLLGEGKTCFHSTNNNALLLFSKDTSYEGIIVDKCFIFNFVLHFYESHTNMALPSKVLLATILEFMVKSFILIPKFYHLSFLSCDALCTCQSISSLVKWEFSSNCYPGSTVTYFHFC